MSAPPPPPALAAACCRQGPVSACVSPQQRACGELTPLSRKVDRNNRKHNNELGLTEAYHVLRVINVADGTNEILNRTIYQRLTGGDTEL